MGVVLWPVGNGDAITIVVDDATVLQIDINHRAVADEDDDDRVPVVDRLVEVLPLSADGEPRLSVLAITHHDEDHCSGFERLIDEVVVEELWVTLRSFIEVDEDGLTEAGQAVYDEACRRRDKEIEAAAAGGRAGVGDRLQVIGNADVLDDDDWKGFPLALLTSAGQFVATINAEDRGDDIEVFVHTPFRSDTEDGSRNSSSLGIQVQFMSGSAAGKRLLLLGDLEYMQIEAFVNKTELSGNDDHLWWDLLLAPHHCSRNAVRRKDGDDWVDADAAEDLRRYAVDGAVVVVSARSFDDIGDDDTDPPHADARDIYESIVGDDAVYYTSDYANGSDSDPLTVSWDENGKTVIDESSAERAERWRSIGTVRKDSKIDPGEEYVRGGDRPYARR